MALKQYEYRAVKALFSREMMPAFFSTIKLASYEALSPLPILRFFSPVSYALPPVASYRKKFHAGKCLT